MASSTARSSTPNSHEAASRRRPTRLVVIVPGFSARVWSAWEPLLERLAKEDGYRPDEADLLKFDLQIRPFSRARLDTIALDLRARIDAKWTEGTFQDVVLVGHSVGGPLIRLAYLLAMGAVDGERPSDWGSKVSRIILLSSINRGLDPKEVTPFFGGLGLRLFSWIARKFHFLPHVVLSDVLRGSSFMTNLRIIWIRLWGTYGDGHATPPTVVQVLGTFDCWVKRADSKDLQAPADPFQIEVPGAKHSDLYRLDTPENADHRYPLLRQAFVALHAIVPASTSTPAQHVVFLLHGMRNTSVEQWITQLAAVVNGMPGPVVAITPNYGYINALTFANPYGRRKYVNRLRDDYTETLAQYPAATYHAIAHSNGSYMLGESLKQNPGMRFSNICLAGSVLPLDFDWYLLKRRGQIAHILNNRANRDWPVALLCNLLRGLRMRDIGTGGFEPFVGTAIDSDLFYYCGGHSAALDPAYHSLLATFAVHGPPAIKPPTLLSSAGYFGWLSRLMPSAAVLVLIGIIAATVSLFLSGQYAWGIVEVIALLIVYFVLLAY